MIISYWWLAPNQPKGLPQSDDHVEEEENIGGWEREKKGKVFLCVFV